MRILLFTRLIPAILAVLAAGCGSNATPATGTVGASGASGAPGAADRAPSPAAFSQPALIALDETTGALVYWPIKNGGGEHPQPLSKSLGIYQGYGLAASGNVIAIANYSPPEVVTYNVQTKAQSTLSDPYGGPLDVAIDKNGTIYAMNINNVAVFPAGSSTPTELTCGYITDGQAIAVDNEGDVFVNGYAGNGMGVAEYAKGSQTCTRPHLRAERGYVGGIGVDPKTDDLIVVDDPDLCAGGLEGRMVIYPKPYEERTSRRRNLGANYCAGTFRLNARSSLIFVSDATVSAGYPLIDQRTYPAARDRGTYESGYYSGDSLGGFTTIPNTLPN